MNFFNNKKSNSKKAALLLLEKCVQCGRCGQVCPLYRLTGRESHSPRGRIAILHAWLKGQLTDNEIMENLQSCAGCGKCGEICRNGLSVPALRRQLMLSGQAHDLRSRYDFFLKKYPSFAFAHAFLSRLPHKKSGRRKAPLMHLFKKEEKTAGAPTVLIYPGCVSSTHYPEIVGSLKNIVRNSGCNVLLPLLPCCGREKALAGAPRQALTLVRKNLAKLSGLKFDYIVTPCPACQREISKSWPDTPGLTAREQAALKNIAAKCVSPESILKFPELEKDAGPAYVFHKPCLLSGANSRKLTEWLASARPVEEVSACCGAGQTELAEALWDRIILKKADCAVTACPACLRQLEKTMGLRRDRLELRHIIEIADEAMRNRKGS